MANIKHSSGAEMFWHAHSHLRAYGFLFSGLGLTEEQSDVPVPAINREASLLSANERDSLACWSEQIRLAQRRGTRNGSPKRSARRR